MRSRSFVSVALFALAGCNVGNAVVGGECRAGFSESGGACEANDAPHASSSSSSPSINGFAGGTATMPTDDPSSPSSKLSPSSPSPGGAGGGGAGSESMPGAPDAGALHCDGSLVACRGECIPVTNDAANCGACGKICPSNLCVEGECQGALAGDVVVLGHDYASSSSTSAQAKMIANAFSIATTDPIRVLAFAASDEERALISTSVRFRGVAFTSATEADLEATDLAKHFDVVLVQDAGSAASYLGARTHGSLETFTKKGGIVVAVDDGASDMPAFLRDSGLLSMDGHEILPADTQIVVAAPNDAVGMQVLSPYAPSGATVGFLGVASSSDVTVVARTNDASAYPTAIHRFVR